MIGYLPSTLLQSTTGTITNYPTVGAQLMPLVILALLIDAVIIVIWYYLGVFLNNSTVKGSALGEFYQLIGTVIMVVAIVGVLSLAASVFYSTASLTTLMSPTQISTLCTNIESSTSLNLINQTNSLLSGPSSSTGNFVGLCTLVNQGSGTTDITSQLDYPLAAVGVIVANLTNQTVSNYNNSFTFDAWIGFLQQLKPTANLCLDPAKEGAACIIPNPVVDPVFSMSASFQPFSGYDMIYSNLNILGGLLNTSVQSFVVQLLVISIFLYGWPYLLFAGFVMRSTFVTRRLGGLLIAIALSGLIIYPAVFSFEYLALGKGLTVTNTGSSTSNPTGYNQTYGFNSVTGINSIISTASANNGNNGNYIVNFFVEPNLKNVGINNNCWPSANTIVGSTTGVNPLIGSEVGDIGFLLLPGGQLFSYLKYAIQAVLPNTNPTLYLPNVCSSQNALNTFFQFINAYGVIGITSFMIPILNIVITISGLVGLSQLFGGDTTLAGISKFL